MTCGHSVVIVGIRILELAHTQLAACPCKTSLERRSLSTKLEYMKEGRKADLPVAGFTLPAFSMVGRTSPRTFYYTLQKGQKWTGKE